MKVKLTCIVLASKTMAETLESTERWQASILHGVNFLEKIFLECLLVQPSRGRGLSIETCWVTWLHCKKIKTLDLFLRKYKVGFFSQVGVLWLSLLTAVIILNCGKVLTFHNSPAKQTEHYLTWSSYSSHLPLTLVSLIWILLIIFLNSSFPILQTKLHFC